MITIFTKQSLVCKKVYSQQKVSVKALLEPTIQLSNIRN